MPANVLAIDLGSTGIKVAVVDDSGAVRAVAGEILDLIVTADGGVEQDPHGWWIALGRCAERAVAESGIAGRDVTLVAVTSQYTSIVPVAADGSPVGNTIMWMDRRGGRPGSRDEGTTRRWLEVHGMDSSGGDLAHLRFLRDERPEVYAAAAAFVEPMDHLAGRLTGHVTATQNTAFPLLATDNRTWGATDYSDELLGMSGVDPARLPRLVPMGAPRGQITGAAAAHLGISPAATVADATIDSVTAAVGSGAVTATDCGLVIGTTTVMATHVPTKRLDVEHGLTTAPSPIRDSYVVLAENGVGGKAFEAFVDGVVYPGDGLGAPRPADAYERVLAAAGTVEPGADGVLYLPWLVGSLAPAYHRHVRGGFVNLGLSTTRAHMARAVLEGVALNAAWLLPHVVELAGGRYGELSFGGGGARSTLWGQVLADVLGIPIRRLANPQATNAHGAALLALAQAGRASLDDLRAMLQVEQRHDPDDAAHAVARPMLDAFVDFHARSAPFYKALNRPATRPATGPETRP